jgi:uncharacterized delta-60 repeat protein
MSRGGIARLNADSSLDLSFNPGSGANRVVFALALQPDGKVLISGNFTAVDGVSRNGIARLNADGSLDRSFDPGSGANWRINALALQPDGKVLIGGGFTAVNGVTRNGIARLNADGSLDPSFDPRGGVSGGDQGVYAFALQPAGKMLIGGVFTAVDGVSRSGIARLNADGSLDPSFDPRGVAGNTYAITVQPDGKVLMGGFNRVDNQPWQGIMRLHNTLPPRLVLSPTTIPIGQEQTFYLEVQIDMASMIADQVRAALRFDPTVLEVVDAAGNPATAITPNPAVVGEVRENRVDAATGEITFSAAQSSSPYLTGSATVATIYVRPKVLANRTQVQFVRNDTQQSDLVRGGTPLQATLEHATVRIMSHRLFIPLTQR